MVNGPSRATSWITEVRDDAGKDGRSDAATPPHLHDGWRHLRFLFARSPRSCVTRIPDCSDRAQLVGIITLLPGPVRIGSITPDIHTSSRRA